MNKNYNVNKFYLTNKKNKKLIQLQSNIYNK